MTSDCWWCFSWKLCSAHLPPALSHESSYCLQIPHDLKMRIVLTNKILCTLRAFLYIVCWHESDARQRLLFGKEPEKKGVGLTWEHWEPPVSAGRQQVTCPEPDLCCRRPPPGSGRRVGREVVCAFHCWWAQPVNPASFRLCAPLTLEFRNAALRWGGRGVINSHM